MITVQEEDQGSDKELEKDKGPKEGDDQVLLTKNPYFSLHALEDTFNYQTMKIKRSVYKRMLCVLIVLEALITLLIQTWLLNLGVLWNLYQNLRF